MAFLSRIKIKGFRSIKELDLELRPLNVLIGANGAGKSNFISSFKLLNEMIAGRLQEHVGRSGGARSLLHLGPKITPQIDVELEFTVKDDPDSGFDEVSVLPYSLRLFHAAPDALLLADEKVVFPKTETSDAKTIQFPSGQSESGLSREIDHSEFWQIFWAQLFTQCRVYHFHDTSSTAQARLSGYLNDNRWLMPDARNLAAMLYAYRKTNSVVDQRIVSAVRNVMPGFDDFDLAPDRLDPNSILLNWRMTGAGDYLFGPHQISDGSLRAIALITLLLQPEVDLPKIIVLDEPELGLHPHALEIIAGLIRAASEKSQVIVATQSLTFLNQFDPAEIITVESHGNESRFSRLDPTELADWLEDYSIGELWQRNVIGGGPLA